MLKLESIKKDAQIDGIVAGQSVRVVLAMMVGPDCCQCVYRTVDNAIHEVLFYRSDEARLSLVETGKQWALDADGADFKLAAEAYRINLAHLFDPYMAVHTAQNVDPLPHQITAVYEHMLPRQPLRFVLADDPGAGKTIMAGLLIRELLLRAAAKRIAIVAPGSLVEQWRTELHEKFGLHFEIYSNAMEQGTRSGNAFEDHHHLIVRLDQVSRNDDARTRIVKAGWDLVIFDEAHKLSASWNGGEIRRTKRYDLAMELGNNTRHLLLMTATPHNGKEEDFQLFLGLLDSDRFFGKFRDGAHKVDTCDLMRRMVKEDLVKFDGKPLFPERKAYTAKFQLSPLEARLYDEVTTYVREGMNRLDRLQDGKKRTAVGFALTALQRRLASSPAAIYNSLQRRHDKLLKLKEEELRKGRVVNLSSDILRDIALRGDGDDWEDELSGEELENQTDELLSGVTVAETIDELDKEIENLLELVDLARELVRSNEDRKWEELSKIVSHSPEMADGSGRQRKILIFTEHKDTLNYLRDKIGNDLLGQPGAVLTISGTTPREERLKTQALFNNDPDVRVLIATDAAGEGVNFQRATNLMINYDLPWNPNRLEQRFGRIHRIGQHEVCHLWNLLADGTREGAVFERLFSKLEKEREALKGKVFDILGAVFEERSLKDLLIEAIRYGDQPEVRDRLNQQIDSTLDTEHCKAIVARNALNQEILDQTRVFEVRHQMEMAEARKLQPFFIQAFFFEAFKALGGEWREREPERFELTFVPAVIRERDRELAGRVGEAPPVLRRYERVCFQKNLTTPPSGKPAELVHPGHPLMQAIMDLMLERHRKTLKRGALMVDPADPSTTPRLLFMLEHRIVDEQARADAPVDVSRELHFVSLSPAGEALAAGPGPHLDLEPLPEGLRDVVMPALPPQWQTDQVEQTALLYAAQALAQPHFERVSKRRTEWVARTNQAVVERLMSELKYWEHRHETLEQDFRAGKGIWPNVQNAKKQIDEITSRLTSRQAELERMRHLRNTMPSLVGAAVVIPQGLLAQLQGGPVESPDVALERKRIEWLAMDAVSRYELARGAVVEDVSAHNCGWDITSRWPDGTERHIEVKGRHKDATTLTVTRNEILYALNQREKFVLAIVRVDGDRIDGPYYVHAPFNQAPDWAEASRNFELNALLVRAERCEVLQA
jgi:superfamily II DNA or RNA helicase